MADPQYSQAQLDAAARQMGFHDYATYQGYQRTRNGIIGAGGGGTGGINPTQPDPPNWLQTLLAKIPIHPAYLLGKVNDAFTKAGQ